ncbi:MAG: Na-K-Cl cotransporter, partial [Cyanobacteria bacterium P01_H01_bin.119]
GAYYMISRSLGIETGGAVGIPLYFAQALSVALYTIGFAESLVEIFPGLNQTLVALVTTVLVTLLALKSADLAIKAQYVIMAAIALSLVSLVLGSVIEPTPLATVETPGSIVGPAIAPEVETPGSVGFWAVLAVFFPAVTGIMSGVNMSGDLKDPRRAIPVGTLAAIGVGYLIYMGIPLLLEARADANLLIAEPLLMRRMALWGGAILLGVWGATLSSALGSILGAPRVLQALARDGILPKRLRWLGNGNGPNDEPRLGTLFSLGIALAVVSLGDLNLIAPVLTMFFLTTYMVLNVAAGIEGFLQSPSFRPTFRVHWAISLIGAIGCLAVMFLINAVATVAAALIVAGIYLWLERRELQSTWGDVRQGMWMTLMRMGLYNVRKTPDTKNWRPHLLVFSGAPTKRWRLIEFAAAFTHNRGLITVASVLPSGSRSLAQQEGMEATIQEYLSKQGIQAMVRLVTAPEIYTGAEILVEAYGIGHLVPNTVLLGDTENPASRDRYCALIAKCHQAKRNVIILRNPSEHLNPLSSLSPLRIAKRRIDVWWGGLQDNGGLMLILAYLLRTSFQWMGSEVRLKLVVPNQTAADAAKENLENLVKGLRIGATSQVIVAEGRSFDEILQSSSKNADLVFLGLAKPHEGFSDYYTKLQQRVANLPTTIFVLASEELAFAELLQKE